MLTRGNSKLGKKIWQWSIPAGTTCPGKTETCDSRCYAQKGHYRQKNVSTALATNLERSRQKDFVREMNFELARRKALAVRIHAAGDFHDLVYLRKWHSIVGMNPAVTFYTYTRSWRIPELREGLTLLANECKNIRMWWSIDRESGYPQQVPRSVKTCYLSTGAHDEPPREADLVFRDHPCRREVQKWMNGVLVCPPENGATSVTCEQCGVCWRGKKVPKGEPSPVTNGRRLPLAVVG